MATAFHECSWHVSPDLLLPYSHVWGAAGEVGCRSGGHGGDLGRDFPSLGEAWRRGAGMDGAVGEKSHGSCA